MKAILQGWNFMRVLRLILGTIITVQGIAAAETVTIILGVLFEGMALANIGCCAANSCASNPGRIISNNTKNFQYDELGNKK